MAEGLDQPGAPVGPHGGEARLRARSVVAVEGADAFQALQRVLYRSAKQDPQRRFHALYDKLARRERSSVTSPLRLWPGPIGPSLCGG